MIQKLCAEFGENVNERIENSKYEIENNIVERDISNNGNNNDSNNH